MSFFDDASLAFLPSGAAGKDGKAYSIKPTDGTGDFTFSRGSNLAATRVGADGLIEKGRENLLTYSNDFSNADWLQVNTTLTSGQSGYDGSSNAWKIEAASTGTIRLRQQKSISANSVITMSVYAKIGNVDFIKFNLLTSGTNSIVTFDLTDGTTYSSNAIDEKWESVGGGWVRISATFVNSLEITEQRIEVRSEYNLLSAPAGSFVYIQDAQLEIGLAVTDVISTGATTGKAGLLEDEPRFDYSGGATCGSLLLEPSRQQLFQYSEWFDGWTTSGSPAPTLTANYAESPEGVDNAYRVEIPSVSGVSFFAQLVSHTSGTDMTVSAYVKSNTATDQSFKLFGDYGTGTGTSGALTATSEWQRFKFTFTPTATGNRNAGIINVANTAADLLVYGMQVEAGSYSTSYIPNHSGGSVTRGADNLNLLNLQSNNLFGSDSGFIFYEFKDFDDLFIGWSSSNSKDRFQYFDIDGSANGYFRFRGYESSISLQVVNLGASPNFLVIPDGSKKICISWNASKFSLFADGSKVGEIPITTSIAVNGISNFNGDLGNKPAFIEELLWGNSTMSDAEAITLTTL